MSKTAKQTADAFSIPAFDPTAVTEQVRQITEKGVAQSKEAYAKIQDQAEAAQKSLETTFETAQSNTAALSLKALAALRVNTEASFAHVEALIGAKSFGEVIELQSAFVRKQAEAISGQAKEFQADATKAIEEISAPVKSAVEKAIKDVKAI
ncbi:phasin [Phyllobacterium chamaecytisi]|uniref:phasin n=1 Tax=Phyllobacterium chamaecytisi TaxID=2876082 RepID=UPI001CCA5965|nr:phasin [Phyllobacterium sp. KW56]MBZ9603323.1 phasin [Phyllobacterium sp. KW56]